MHITLSPAHLILNILQQFGLYKKESYGMQFSIDSLGHMGVCGKTGYNVLNGSNLFPHSVTFGFEFDPSQLAKATKVDWVRKNAAIQKL